MASSAAPAAAAPGPLPRIAVAYDGSEHSALAATWAAQHLLRPGHKIVLPGLDAYVADIKLQDQEKVNELVRMAKALASKGVPVDDIQAVIIPTAGDAGAGGEDVAKPLLSWAQHQNIAHLVVGSRGVGCTKKKLMSLVGLGSTSDYLSRNSKLPFTIVPCAPAKEQ